MRDFNYWLRKRKRMRKRKRERKRKEKALGLFTSHPARQKSGIGDA